MDVSLFRPKTKEIDAVAKDTDEFLAKGGKIYKAKLNESAKDSKKIKKQTLKKQQQGEIDSLKLMKLLKRNILKLMEK